MKLARAISIAARQQQADTVSEQTATSAAIDNRHQVCQEANAGCMLRGNIIAREDEKREYDWSCGVCYEEVCHPYTLPCGHTICGACLEQLLVRETKCPFCRLSVFRGCTFGRNVAMWNAIQARHPAQAAALPEKPPVITVQRRLQQASARHQTPGVQAFASAGRPGQPDPNIFREILTALQQDPFYGHFFQRSTRDSAGASSDGLGILAPAATHDPARAARPGHVYRPYALGLARSGHPAAEQVFNVLNVGPVLPHSTSSFSHRTNSNHGLSAESILAATHAANAQTTSVPVHRRPFPSTRPGFNGRPFC